MGCVLSLIPMLSVIISTSTLWSKEDSGKVGDWHAVQLMDKSDDPGQAWASIQLLVKEMETAVQSKNLHGIHEPSMKIRGPIKVLKRHSAALNGGQGQEITAALKQLDGSVTDLHSASDEGNQAEAEKALKSVETALEQLKSNIKP